MTKPRFATFWQGRFSAYEAACVASFVKRGYEITVYSYGPIENVPEGALQADASEIAPAAAMARFIFGGKPNLSHYSDYFRYLLFSKTDLIWVDADMLLVRDFDVELPQTILAREVQPSICGAIMRIRADDDHLSNLIRKTEAAMDRELLWGETGPMLLSKEFGAEALLRQAFGADRFYALAHDDFWKVLLPDYAAECEATTERSWGVHLWNNVVDRLGIWKKLAPPTGSFLSNKFRDDGTLSFFDDAYPAAIMKQMIENWQLRQSGDALGIKQVTKQVIPSVYRTIRHHTGYDLSSPKSMARRLSRSA